MRISSSRRVRPCSLRRSSRGPRGRCGRPRRRSSRHVDALRHGVGRCRRLLREAILFRRSRRRPAGSHRSSPARRRAASSALVRKVLITCWKAAAMRLKLSPMSANCRVCRRRCDAPARRRRAGGRLRAGAPPLLQAEIRTHRDSRRAPGRAAPVPGWSCAGCSAGWRGHPAVRPAP